MPEIHRRDFLKLTALLGGAALGSWLPISNSLAASTPSGLLFASASSQGERHALSFGWLKPDGLGSLQHVPLPARAHEVIVHPTEPWLLVVARRPGTYMFVVDYRSGEVVRKIVSAKDRHVFGHAIFTADGRHLIYPENKVYPENDIKKGEGRIVIRDLSADFAIIADHPAYGIDTHQIALMADQKTLVIANGGVQTTPDASREKLNVETMRSSLDFIDLMSGQHLDQQTLDPQWQQCSLRHLDINARGDIIVAMQYEGAPNDDAPLVALKRHGETLKPLWGDATTRFAMKQYCGSAKWNSRGDLAAISSPRGNLITLWRGDNGELHSTQRLNDGCGLAALAGDAGFLASSGNGHLLHIDPLRGSAERIIGAIPDGLNWDNHLLLE